MSPRSADEIRRDLDRIEAFGPGQHLPDETRRLVADVEPLLARIAELEGRLTASDGLRAGLTDALREHRCQASV